MGPESSCKIKETGNKGEKIGIKKNPISSCFCHTKILFRFSFLSLFFTKTYENVSFINRNSNKILIYIKWLLSICNSEYTKKNETKIIKPFLN